MMRDPPKVSSEYCDKIAEKPVNTRLCTTQSTLNVL